MIKVRILGKNVFDSKGVRVPAGTELELKSIPAHLVGKVTVISGGDEDEEGGKEAAIEALQARYKELAGQDAKANWGVPKLTQEIAALEGGK
jgi:hypothetical protein